MRKSKKLNRTKRQKLNRTKRQKKLKKAGDPEGEVRFLLKKKLEESTGIYEPALVDQILSYFPRRSVVRAIRNQREMDRVLEHIRIKHENKARAEKIIADSKEQIEEIDKELQKLNEASSYSSKKSKLSDELSDEKQILLKRIYDYENQIHYQRYNFNI
tara:strand:+ start:32 stop:508 length:477 start_codon:yes stop_codon:yes gene_type:complete